MAKYFVFKEFTESEAADRLKIDNTPTEEYIQDNILQMMHIMDKIREKWTDYCEENYLENPAIIVNSGYRCEALNKALNGSKTSQHRYGAATDFEALNGENKALFDMVVDMIEKKEIRCSQLIDERDYAWIHIGLYQGGKLNQILHL